MPLLIAEGHDVVGLDSELFRDCTFGDGVPDIPVILKDIRDVESNDLEGINAVIHLSGLSKDPLGD